MILFQHITILENLGIKTLVTTKQQEQPLSRNNSFGQVFEKNGEEKEKQIMKKTLKEEVTKEMSRKKVRYLTNTVKCRIFLIWIGEESKNLNYTCN